ncbi:hypothetical protein B0H63DRAFT_240452 [Podospora didyma]|uniref:Uncharacterized protein n=1 Tax=Podospora didyma TaxID=330526 RepID=A0AAE0KK16_9PEZI|nr:hypothetical protein B0H63DRAFT_240452 [Podospora didyma]
MKKGRFRGRRPRLTVGSGASVQSTFPLFLACIFPFSCSWLTPLSGFPGSCVRPMTWLCALAVLCQSILLAKLAVPCRSDASCPHGSRTNRRPTSLALPWPRDRVSIA